MYISQKKIKGVKAEAFKKINPVTTYRVQYQDIGLALENLRLSSEYVVLYNSINNANQELAT